MRNRKKLLDNIVKAYHSDQDSKKKKKSVLVKILTKWKTLMMIFKWVKILFYVFLISWGFMIILLLILFLFAGTFGLLTGIISTVTSFVAWLNFTSYFSTQYEEVPYGIPVERGLITAWFDDGSDPYWFGTYSGHEWLDIWRLQKDKNNWYAPLIFTTHKWQVVHMEVRSDDPNNPNKYIYTKYTYSESSGDHEYYEIDTKDYPKNNYTNTIRKPYGTHIVVRETLWDYQTLYGHLSKVSEDILKNPNVVIWQFLWYMWTTGNSTWPHLHYEIRDCSFLWQAKNLFKLQTGCNKINPLNKSDHLNGDNHLGIPFDLLEQKGNIVLYAWHGSQREKIVSEEDENSGIIAEYNDFCNKGKLYFIQRKVECKYVFPIYYQNKDRGLFPHLITDLEKKEVFLRYIKNEYNLTEEDLNDTGKLTTLRREEIIIEEDINVIIEKITGKLSYGRYYNKEKYYNKYDVVTEDINDIMMEDTINSLNEIFKSWKRWNDLYISYFDMPYYKRKENPYIYNMIDREHIHMYIMDNNGEEINVYEKDWVIKTFNTINK